MLLKSCFSRFALAALAAMVAAGMPAWAVTVPAGGSLIDDCEGGTNENKFHAYWYFYDDNTDGGNSQITNATKDATTNSYAITPIAGQGNAGTAGFRLDYKLGTVGASCGTACSYNFVGMGTMLALDGSTLNVTGATKITYWAKASAATTLNVEVATSGVLDFGYHRKLQNVTTTWTQYEILLVEGTGVAQPTWADPVALDLTKATKVQWQVHTDQTPPSQGSIFIDDVVIENYTFVYTPPEACPACVTTTGSQTGALFSNMDTKPANQNAAGGYWYCYNDAKGRAVTSQTEFSDITSGATKDATDLTAPPLLQISTTGGAGGTGAAVIEYELGPAYPEGSTTVKPFIGLGTSLCDNLETMFYNAAADGATGVYFEYQCTGVDYLRFEVQTTQAFPNAGIVFHRLLPKTAAGEWKAAKVMFSDLMLPNWDEVKALPPSLKTPNVTALKKLQWAIQGDPGATGKLAIDNVYLIGATKVSAIGSMGVKAPKTAMQVRGIRATVSGENLTIDCSSASSPVQRISLINTRGDILSSAAVGKDGVFSMNVRNCAQGVYLAKLTLGNGSEMSVPLASF